MPPANPSTHYSPALQTLHWLTVALVFTGYLMAPDGSEQQIYSAAGDFDRRTHETLGISVFLLTLARLAWRRFERAPKHEAMPAWLRRAACATHAILYALLFAVPLTAVAGTWLSGHPLTLWGIPDIAPMVSESRELGKAIVGWHATLGDALIYLAALHAAAANSARRRERTAPTPSPPWYGSTASVDERAAKTRVRTRMTCPARSVLANGTVARPTIRQPGRRCRMDAVAR